MRSVLLSVFIMIYLAASGFAQEVTFTSNAQAMKFIGDLCNDHWERPNPEVALSRAIEVYSKGGSLYFSEKTLLLPGNNGSVKRTKTKIINISLLETRLIGNDSVLEFIGKNKCINTLTYYGHNKTNGKVNYLTQFRLPLDYKNDALRTNIPELSDAVVYLKKHCYVKKISH